MSVLCSSRSLVKDLPRNQKNQNEQDETPGKFERFSPASVFVPFIRACSCFSVVKIGKPRNKMNKKEQRDSIKIDKIGLSKNLISEQQFDSVQKVYGNDVG